MTQCLPLLRAGILLATLHRSHLHPKPLYHKTLIPLLTSPFSASSYRHRLPRNMIPRFRDQRAPMSLSFCSGRTEASTFGSEEEEEELNVEARERSKQNNDREEEEFFNYGEPEFWDRTYAKENEPLEWYQSYGDMAPLVRRYIPLSSRVLMAGCGNAEMSEHMVNDGFSDIVNIDNSSIVIEAMQNKYHNVPQLKYLTMDVTKLSFDDCSFDAVIDKAGGPYSVPMMIAEVNRILKPGGLYMLITTGNPKSRLPLLNASVFHWNITLYVIPKPASKTAVRGCLEAYSESVSLNADGTYATKHVLEREDQLFVFICTKP